MSNGDQPKPEAPAAAYPFGMERRRDHNFSVEESEAERIFLRRESDLMEAAVKSVKAIEPYYAKPAKIGNDVLLGWAWAIQRGEISQEVAETKLREDIQRVLHELREPLWRLQSIEVARLSVLIHLSLVLGAEQVRSMKTLWRALETKDYESAHDALLMTNWPAIIGADGSEQSKRRVVAMCRAMRTGQPPILTKPSVSTSHHRKHP